MQLSAKTPPFSGYMGGDKEGGNEPYLPETDLTLKYGSYQPLGWFSKGYTPRRKMAKSEYLQREEAAKKQLGTKGVKKRVKQLPTAARAFTKEMTGIDISRKGVSVDPLGVAMALPLGKVLKAAKVVRAAGLAGRASAMEARNVAKLAGREAGKRIAKANNPATSFGVGRDGGQVLSDWIRSAVAVGKETRSASKQVFPRKKGPLTFEASTWRQRGVQPSKGWATRALADFKKNGAGWQDRAVKSAVAKANQNKAK